MSSPHSPPWPPATASLLPLSVAFPRLDLSHTRNPTARGLSGLAASAEHGVFGVRPVVACVGASCYSGIPFRCLGAPRFVCPFVWLGTGLFPLLGCCEWLCDHRGSPQPPPGSVHRACVWSLSLVMAAHKPGLPQQAPPSWTRGGPARQAPHPGHPWAPSDSDSVCFSEPASDERHGDPERQDPLL